jgi:GAF domain-containing protein
MMDTKEEKILSALFLDVARVMDVDRLYATMLNKVTLGLDFPLVVSRTSDGLEEHNWPSRAYQPDKLLPDRVLSTGQAILIETSFESWLVKSALAYAGEPLPRSYLAVPMKARDDVLGVIVAEHMGREGAYDRRNRTVLTTMVDGVTSAIAYARLIEKLAKVGELGLMLTSGIRLSETEIVESIFQQIGQFVNTDNAYVALYDAGQQLLSFPLITFEGDRERVPPRQVDLVAETRGGLAEIVIRTQEPLRIADVQAFSHFLSSRPPSLGWASR